MEYFKEIEDEYLKKPYFCVRREKIHDNNIIPMEFYIKYRSVFTRMSELSNHINLIIVSEKNRALDSIDGNFNASQLIDGISYNIKVLLYKYSNGESEKEKQLVIFFERYGTYHGKISLPPKEIANEEEYHIFEYKNVFKALMYHKELLEILNKLDDGSLLKDINSAINDLSKLWNERVETCYTECFLPDSWYILPGSNGMCDCLYNATNKRGEIVTPMEDILDEIFNKNIVYSSSVAEIQFSKARELNDRDFVDHNVYSSIIRYGAKFMHSRILDCFGRQYGIRESFLRDRISSMREYFSLYMEHIIPLEKQSEFYNLITKRLNDFSDLCLEYMDDIIPKENRERLDDLIAKKEREFDNSISSFDFYDILFKGFEYPNAACQFSENITQEELDRIAKYSDKFKNMTLESYINIQIYNIMTGIEKNFNDVFAEKIEDFYGSPSLFNQMAKKLVVGYYMATALVAKFFTHLYENAKNYGEELDFLRKISPEEILIRCCGFNMVLREVKDGKTIKKIVTSNPNYEKDFKEYIDCGWKIQFLPPITLSEDTKKLETMGAYRKV